MTHEPPASVPLLKRVPTPNRTFTTAFALVWTAIALFVQIVLTVTQTVLPSEITIGLWGRRRGIGGVDIDTGSFILAGWITVAVIVTLTLVGLVLEHIGSKRGRLFLIAAAWIGFGPIALFTPSLVGLYLFGGYPSQFQIEVSAVLGLVLTWVLTVVSFGFMTLYKDPPPR